MPQPTARTYRPLRVTSAVPGRTQSNSASPTDSCIPSMITSSSTTQLPRYTFTATQSCGSTNETDGDICYKQGSLGRHPCGWANSGRATEFPARVAGLGACGLEISASTLLMATLTGLTGPSMERARIQTGRRPALRHKVLRTRGPLKQKSNTDYLASRGAAWRIAHLLPPCTRYFRPLKVPLHCPIKPVALSVTTSQVRSESDQRDSMTYP